MLRRCQPSSANYTSFSCVVRSCVCGSSSIVTSVRCSISIAVSLHRARASTPKTRRAEFSASTPLFSPTPRRSSRADRRRFSSRRRRRHRRRSTSCGVCVCDCVHGVGAKRVRVHSFVRSRSVRRAFRDCVKFLVCADLVRDSRNPPDADKFQVTQCAACNQVWSPQVTWRSKHASHGQPPPGQHSSNSPTNCSSSIVVSIRLCTKQSRI